MKKTIDYTALADTIRAELNARHDRSAWNKAVTLYALDLLDDVQEGADNIERLPLDGAELERWALNGASCWEQYSNGGCSLCYNADIAARVCTPSELKRKHGGAYEPNSRETWLDVQAPCTVSGLQPYPHHLPHQRLVLQGGAVICWYLMQPSGLPSGTWAA